MVAGLAGCDTGGSPPDRSGGPAANTIDTVAVADTPTEMPTDSLGTGGAVAVVRSYYDALRRRDYEQAYDYWEGDGAASGQTFEEFRDGFAETASVEVEIGEPGALGAAAGSRYVDVPVSITAVTTDGIRQRFEGAYTLRRAVVDGATPEQRRWRIYSAEIHEIE